MYRKHSDLGKGVIFLYFFKSPTSTCYKIQTKTYINILRHASLQMGLRNIAIFKHVSLVLSEISLFKKYVPTEQ